MAHRGSLHPACPPTFPIVQRSHLFSLLNNKYEEDLCLAFCDAVGLYEFIKLIENQDFDFIYMCELVDACAVDDCTVRSSSLPSSHEKPSILHQLLASNIYFYFRVTAWTL